MLERGKTYPTEDGSLQRPGFRPGHFVTQGAFCFGFALSYFS
jgi:hypothetical protein